MSPAPTITIDGVTSNPGQPVTMLALECGCFPIVDGHDIDTGDVYTCGRPTTVTGVFKTWVF
jgi:hypothetical protein